MTDQEQADAVVTGLAGFKVGDKVWAELAIDSTNLAFRTEPLAGVIVHITKSTLSLARLYIVDFRPCGRFKNGDRMSTHERELTLRHD